MKARIVVLPGDGVGPEVTAAAVDVLQAVATRFGHTFDLEEKALGGVALAQNDDPLPPDTLKACESADAVFLGAVGDPRYDDRPPSRRPEAGLLGLRRALRLHANLRPARVDPSLVGQAALKPERLAGVDMLIVRELGGGLYYGEPRGEREDGATVNTLCYSASEVERIAKVAFEAAASRQRRVTSVDKANVLEVSQLWRRTVTKLGAEQYPSITLDHMYVDACAMSLLLEPSRFDVVVTENMFGDILSDEAGAVVGSLGLLPSASLGEGPGLFEPVHGSAPTLAGRDVANPIGAIASMAMLLRHGLDLNDEAAAVDAAIAAVLAGGLRPADIAADGRASVGCREMGRAIADATSAS